MFCPNCGSRVSSGSRFCTNCGASFDAGQRPQQPQYQQQQQRHQQQPQYQQPYQQQYQQQQYYQASSQPSVGFIDAIKLYFINYANFNGRATRSEYWWAMLFVFLVQLVASFLWITVVLPVIVYIGLLIPDLSICIRRFHDIGKPWPWILFGLIPLAGPIIIIVFCCQPSVGGNMWGPDPHTLPRRV